METYDLESWTFNEYISSYMATFVRDFENFSSCPDGEKGESDKTSRKIR